MLRVFFVALLFILSLRAPASESCSKVHAFGVLRKTGQSLELIVHQGSSQQKSFRVSNTEASGRSLTAYLDQFVEIEGQVLAASENKNPSSLKIESLKPSVKAFELRDSKLALSLGSPEPCKPVRP